jgi:hypothetical protein
MLDCAYCGRSYHPSELSHAEKARLIDYSACTDSSCPSMQEERDKVPAPITIMPPVLHWGHTQRLGGVMTQHTASKEGDLTEEEFYAIYKPLMTTHGDLRLFEPRTDDPKERKLIETAIVENRLWTMHHGEYDSVYFWNGPHFVNRLDYVICEVPYAEGVNLITYDPNHLPNWYCEHCGTEYDSITRERYDELSEGIPCCETCPGEEETCATCEDPFGEGESAQSRVDPTQCHYCYTNGADEEDNDIESCYPGGVLQDGVIRTERED